MSIDLILLIICTTFCLMATLVLWKHPRNVAGCMLAFLAFIPVIYRDVVLVHSIGWGVTTLIVGATSVSWYYFVRSKKIASRQYKDILVFWKTKKYK